jgi:GTP cyclohydrolase I
MDREKIARGVSLILEGIGEETDRPGLRETPARVADLYAEICGGIAEDPRGYLVPIEGERHDEMVLLRDIPFYSICEHHLTPFIGKAHIAYIPDGGRIVGLSKLARALEALARRPQVQERLTSRLADIITETIAPMGTMVVIEAEHLCLSMRGVRKPGTVTVTSAIRGIFRKNASTRAEMLSLLEKGRS